MRASPIKTRSASSLAGSPGSRIVNPSECHGDLPADMGSVGGGDVSFVPKIGGAALVGPDVSCMVLLRRFD